MSDPHEHQTNAEVSDGRLREPNLYAEIIAIVEDCSERMKRSGESHRMFAKWVSEGVNALLNRRSVTSQASEGAVAWPEWASDKHIAEGILAEAETIVQLIIHGHEEQIAEHTGAIKSYAGTLLGRENHRHKYASPSKRVEWLEAAREYEIRRPYFDIIEKLVKFAKAEKLSPEEMDEVDKIAEEHSWDGLSCYCGGGWLVGHRDGCPEAQALQGGRS